MGTITNRFGPLVNPPLVYTVIMVRFPDQSALDSKISNVQEALLPDYPIFKRRLKSGIEVTQREDGHTLSTSQIPEYIFLDEKRDRGVLLMRDRVLFHSMHYPDFPAFYSWFDDALNAVIEGLGLTHYTTLGIRYIDVIEPNMGESIEDYLVAGLAPFAISSPESLILKGDQQVYAFETSLGTLVLKKYSIPYADLKIPPELRDISSLLRHSDAKTEGPFAVLDCDHVYTVPDGGARKFDKKSLKDTIESLHETASYAFSSSVVEEAFARWK